MRQALNLDVLCFICELLPDTATVLSFSLVSHSLRSVAVKRLLRMEPVGLRNERTVRGFHRFIFADAHSRLPLLRALNISFKRVVGEKNRQEVADCILDLLEHATHLESLVLPCPRQTFQILADPRIPEAISGISTLRELGLRDGYHHREGSTEMAGIVKYTRSASCLRILRFPLSALPSTCGYGYGVKIAVLDECLYRLAPTLELLVLETTTPGSILFDTKGTQYLALRSLTMGINDGLVRMDILVHKFPALDGTLDIRSSCMRDDEPKQQQIRASNLEQQKRQSWRHLDCVMGDVLALFTLGLTCAVRRLVVDGFRTHKKSQLVEILRSAPPTHFNLSVLLDRWHADDGHNDVFLGLFPPEVLPRLTHLVLVLDYGIFPENVRETNAESMHWHALLADIISSISGLHLTHLRLVVHYCIDLTTDEDDDEDDPVDYSKDFVRSIVDIDHEHLATELMAAIPSLQHIFIGTGGSFVVGMRPSSPIVNEDWPNGFDPRRAVTRGRWFAHSAWRPSYPGVPRRLHPVEMDRKLLEEDLVLSENDNFSLGFQKTWSAEETAPWPLPE